MGGKLGRGGRTKNAACFAEYNSDVLSFAITDTERFSPRNGDSAGNSNLLPCRKVRA